MHNTKRTYIFNKNGDKFTHVMFNAHKWVYGSWIFNNNFAARLYIEWLLGFDGFKASQVAKWISYYQII